MHIAAGFFYTQTMGTSWIAAFNTLFPLISQQRFPPDTSTTDELGMFDVGPTNPAYFSGPKFIKLAQQFNPSISHYKEFIDRRREQGKSGSRQDYFYDILKDQHPDIRLKILNKIIDDIEAVYPTEIKQVRAALLGEQTILKAQVSAYSWNHTRLNNMFSDIDQAIASANYERAITLCYTCIEGLFKSFILQNIPTQTALNEIIKMAREIKNFIHSKDIYPEEVSNSIITISNAINNTRNKYSESHFNHTADNSLSIYIRDLANSLAKLLIQHMH